MIASASGPLADPPEQLRAFIRDGQITAFPAKRARRRLLLDQVAQAFEPGRRYPEAEVDGVLKAIFHDHCTLRRYLVDEAFLSRSAAGLYWRAGGSVGSSFGREVLRRSYGTGGLCPGRVAASNVGA